MTDTYEQSIAQTYDRHISVTANAGSGKTRVLTNRYIKLLLAGADPSEIVAITFTKKAAAEMEARIIKQLDKMRSEKDADSSLIYKLAKIRERMHYSRISTIHSFCNSIIKDYPLEAEVDPNFGELAKAEKIKIIDNAIEIMLEDRINNPDTEEESKSVFFRYGKEKLKEYLKRLINEAYFLELEKENPGINRRRIENKETEIIEIYIEPHVKHEAGLVLDIAKSLDPEAKWGRMKIQYIFDTIDEYERAYQVYCDNPDLNTLKILSKFLAEFYKILLNDKNDLKPTVMKKSKLDLSEYQPSKELIQYKDFLASLENLEVDKEMLADADLMYNMAIEANEIVEEEKRLRNALDFEDMMLKCLKALKNEKVQKDIQSRIKFVLMDEFQDTNPLQYELVKQIISAYSDSNPENDNVNFFIVGDAKQSIYAFRQADVRLFIQAQDEIRKMNKRKIESGQISDEFTLYNEKKKARTDNEVNGNLYLSTSFRLQPVVASFLNLFFNDYMKKEDSEFDTDYEDMTCGRNVSYFKENDILDIPSDNTDYGSINLINIVNNEEENLISNEEASAIYINNIVNGKSPLHIDDDGEKRKVNYSDIAIIFRKNKNISAMAEALRKEKIPYFINNGDGFYQCSEVTDIVSLLQILIDKNNDLALAATLNSLMFNSGTNMLLNIGQYNGYTLWEKLNKFVLNNDEDELENQRKIASELIKQVNKYSSEIARISISRLISLLLKENFWNHHISKYNAAEQIRANIRKLKNIAKSYDRSSFKNIHDFVKDMLLLSKEDKSEPEATFAASTDAVLLLSTHASKGLEFPVVILQEAEYDFGNSQSDFSFDFGLAVKITENHKDIKYPLREISKILEKQLELAGEKRLMYVAMSRAKDHLVFVKKQEDPEKKSRKSKYDFISRLEEVMIQNEQDNKIESPLRIYLNGEEKDVKLYYKVNIINELHREGGSAFNEDSVKTYNALFGKSVHPITEEYFSPTKFIQYNDNPEKYFLKYRLGLESEYVPDELSMDRFDMKPYAPDASEYGTLLHTALEHMNEWIENEEINNEKLKENLHKIFEKKAFKDDEQIFDHALKEIKNIFSTKFMIQNLDYVRNGDFEKELLMPIGGNIMVGSIDILINKNSVYQILDWKSNKVRHMDDANKLAKKYKIQMKIYAYMLHLLYPDQNQIEAKLLFTKLADTNANDDEWTVTFSWTKEELHLYGDEIKRMAAEIQADLNFYSLDDVKEEI